MNHKVLPCQMAFFHGHTSMVRFMNEHHFKAFRCEENMDQEEWPCTKEWMCWFFNVSPNMKFWGIFISCFTFSPSSSLISSILRFAKKKQKRQFFAMVFAMREPLLPLSAKPIGLDIVDDNVGLKTCLWGTSSLMAPLRSFPCCTYNPTSLIRHSSIRQPQYNEPIGWGAPQLGDTTHQNWRILNSPPSIPEGTSTPLPTWSRMRSRDTTFISHNLQDMIGWNKRPGNLRGFHTTTRFDTGLKSMSKDDAQGTCLVTVYMRSQIAIPGHHLHLTHTTSKTWKDGTKHWDMRWLPHHYSLRHRIEKTWAKAVPRSTCLDRLHKMNILLATDQV